MHVYLTAMGSWKKPTKSWPSMGSPWTIQWPTSRPSASCRAPLPRFSSRWPGGPSLRWPVRQFHVHPRLRAPSRPTPPRYPQAPVYVFWSRDFWKLTSTLTHSDDFVSQWQHVETIELVNDGTGLGFGIVGGKTTGVIVKTILPGGIADQVLFLLFSFK